MIHIGQTTIIDSFQVDTQLLMTVHMDIPGQFHAGDILEGENSTKRWRIETFALVRWTDPSYILTRESLVVTPLAETILPPNGLVVQIYRPDDK
ncbi:MAG: hypothetical protein AB1607_17575 [Chloroflexota bacterium]